MSELESEREKAMRFCEEGGDGIVQVCVATMPPQNNKLMTCLLFENVINDLKYF